MELGTTFANPDSTSIPEVVTAVLAGHRGELVDDAIAQLMPSWSRELADLSPAQVREIVEARITSPRWAHMRRPGGEAAKPAPAAQAQSPREQIPWAGSDAQAAAMLAQGERVTAQLKANLTARRAEAPGLAGDYR